MIDELPNMDRFTRRHVGPHGAFTLRTNPEHVDLARAAVAHRLDVPVGEIVIEWPWKRPVHEVVAIRTRRAA